VIRTLAKRLLYHTLNRSSASISGSIRILIKIKGSSDFSFSIFVSACAIILYKDYSVFKTIVSSGIESFCRSLIRVYISGGIQVPSKLKVLRNLIRSLFFLRVSILLVLSSCYVLFLARIIFLRVFLRVFVVLFFIFFFLLARLLLARTKPPVYRFCRE
jgi:hypothetical protein